MLYVMSFKSCLFFLSISLALVIVIMSVKIKCTDSQNCGFVATVCYFKANLLDGLNIKGQFFFYTNVFLIYIRTQPEEETRPVIDKRNYHKSNPRQSVSFRG